MTELSYEQAFRWFGCKPGEAVTLENLYLRLATWRNNNSGDPDQYYTRMNRAYAVLASKLVIEVWDKVSLLPITVEDALVMFGHRTWDKPQTRFMLNYEFRLLAPRRSATLQDAEQFDSAYRVLYDHAERRDDDHDYILEPPFAPTFKALAAKDAAAGWDTTKHFNEQITYKEAEAVFGIPDVAKLTSPEVTAIFRELQGRCTSVEEAHKLDCAYRFLFSVLLTHERHFSAPIDSPYAPVLAKKLSPPSTVGDTTMRQPSGFGIVDFIDRYNQLKERREFNRCATTTDARRWFAYEPEERFTLEDLQSRYAQWKQYSADEPEHYHTLMARAYELLFYEGRATSTEQQTTETLVALQEARKLWASIQPFFKKIGYPEARHVFVSHCFEKAPSDTHEAIIKDLFPWQITDLFQVHQARCTTLEEARQFDEAYQCIFDRKHSMARTSGLIDHPYSLTFTQEQSVPVGAVNKPVTAEEVQEDVEAPPPVAAEDLLQPDMSVDEAISVFVFENKEALELGELTRQYKKFAIREGLSPEMLEEIDTAYQVLRAHLEKEVAYQAERTRFGYGLKETFTREDLRDRYELASEKTDSKAEQKALDEAYQVLLKIAV